MRFDLFFFLYKKGQGLSNQFFGKQTPIFYLKFEFYDIDLVKNDVFRSFYNIKWGKHKLVTRVHGPVHGLAGVAVFELVVLYVHYEGEM